MSGTYIKLSTKEYPRHAGDIEIDPAGAEDYAPVEWVDPPVIDRSKQHLTVGSPLLVDGQYVINWVVLEEPTPVVLGSDSPFNVKYPRRNKRG